MKKKTDGSIGIVMVNDNGKAISFDVNTDIMCGFNFAQSQPAQLVFTVSVSWPYAIYPPR